MKKIKFAFRDCRVLMSFILGLVITMLFTTVVLIDKETVFNWASGKNACILFALVYGAIMIFLMPDNGGGLKFMRTLPLTHRDITDVRILEQVVTALTYFAAQAVWLVIFRRADMVIYYFSAYMIILAAGVAITPLLAENNTGKPAAEKKETAVRIVKAIFCAGIMPFGAAFLGTAVCAGGLNGTLGIGAAALICGICVVLIIFFDLLYRNLIKYYI